jgi:hypothetical protein
MTAGLSEQSLPPDVCDKVGIDEGKAAEIGSLYHFRLYGRTED